MAQNEKSSARASAIASKAMQNPQSLSADEIKTLAASVLDQGNQQGQQSSQQSSQHSGQQNQQGNPQNQQQKRP